MTVLVVGMSHRSAPAVVLQRAALGTEDVPKVLAELIGTECIGEALVLSTCNRFEVYAGVSRFHGAVAEIGAILARTAGVPVGDIAEHGYVHFAEAASEHMMRVAAGLDSMVVGEAQILGQLRAAYLLADGVSSVGRELHALVQAALHAGKRAHSETGIDRSGACLASVGLDRVEALTGPLSGRDVVVVGAGSMGTLVAKRATERGAELTVVNRGIAAARRVAESVQSSWLVLDDSASVAAAIAAADVVVSVTGSAGAVLGVELIGDRASHPLALLDLAVPSDVTAAAAALPGVSYVDIEALRDAGPIVSDQDVANAAAIIAEELQAFLDQQQALAVAPTVTALRARADSVIDSELRRLDTRLPDLSVAARAEVAQAVRRAVEKLLHAPTVRVKELAAGPDGDGYAAALRILFDLDPASIESVATVSTARPESGEKP